MSKKYAIYGIIGVLFLTILYVLVPENNEEHKVVTKITIIEKEERVAAKPFEVLDVNGNIVKLSDYKGKKVMVNFWATWCPPCNKEMPYLSELSQDKEFEYEILTINFIETEQKSKEEVENYIIEKGYKFKITFDDGAKGKVADIYNINSIPTTLFIDEDGYIMASHIGALENIVFE
ncbi:MAG: TlpA family protein disulfide reductase [Clostridia bacterium]|jgi:thiol-disulfide isomerase/thioredoxin|nr:TlpA family protein disulfide reductase [Clostridia bacterium]